MASPCTPGHETSTATPYGVRGAPIAIVGLSALMPEAADLAAFWSNILRGVDCIRDLPEGRWRRDLYLDSDKSEPDRAYVARGGFLPPVPFDPLAFGLPPKALESLDASQLLGLLAAKAALEDAGCAPGTADHARTGVVLGLAGTTMKSLHDLRAGLEVPLWEKVLREQGLDSARVAEIAATVRRLYPDWDENSFPGFLANVVAGRIANRFDLGGPAFAVDAACASSLCAVGLAMDALAAGRADMMLTGGLDTDNGLTAFLSFSKTPALSPSGAVRAFDAGADGTLISEGVGLLVLKRLADAERDGDRVYAVLRGYGATSDGRSKSIYAPRVEGQARAVQEALSAAGLKADAIDLVEAHATGTEVGDAVEFEALEQVFGTQDEAPHRIALGSIKSQIGHTKAAAGAASLIKTALALHHKALPPTLNVEHPSPRMNLDGSSFYLNTRTRPWLTVPHRPRCAGVSAFGFGGANVHLVLEEAPGECEPLPLATSPVGIVVDAEAPEALIARCRDLAERLGSGTAAAEFADLADAPPPAPARPRVGFVARDAAEAARALLQAADTLGRQNGDAWSLPSGVHYRAAALPEAGRGALVALFPGQGSQYVEMGAELAIAFPQVRAALERLDARYAASGFELLSSVVYPPPSADPDAAARHDAELRRTLYAQGGVGALSLGLLRVLESSGFRPDFTAGHSFGELTALAAGGALDEETYLDLVLARGQALTPPEGLPDAGALLVVELDGTSVDRLLDSLPDVRIANANAPRQTVLGGSVAAVEVAAEKLAALGHSVVRLPVAAAFHTPSVGYAEAPWRKALGTAPIAAPGLPVACNVSGVFHDADGEQVRAALAAQPFRPVLFQKNVEAIYAAGGRVFVEVGPRPVLTRLVEATLGDRPHLALSLDPGRSGDGERRLRDAIVQLRVAGLPLAEPQPVKRPHRPEPLPDHGAVVWIDGESVRAVERRRQVESELVDLARDRPPLQAVSGAASSATPEAPAASARPEGREALVGRALDLEEATLAAHRDFLALQAEQAQLLAELRRSGAEGALFERVAAQQAEVTRLHSDFLTEQRRQAHGLLAPDSSGVVAMAPAPEPRLPAQPAVAEPGAELPVPEAGLASAPPAASDILPALLEIVAEATGYPADFLDPDMDMEADLGIDSIKRVEILSALRQALGEAGRQAGSLPKAALAGPRSLQALADQLARHVTESLGGKAGTLSSPATSATASEAPAEAAKDLDSLSALLAGIVADKTGYPEDMLAPDLDIEADLGIDSIKRVEILSALRQALGCEADWPDRRDLAGARTLGAVARLLAGAAASVASEAATSAGQPANQNNQLEEADEAGRASLDPVSMPAAVSTGRLRWHDLRPTASPGRLPGGAIVIYGDGGALTVELARALETAGATAVVLQPPAALVASAIELPEALHRLPLADAARATLETTLARIERLFGPIVAGLFCWPGSADEGADPVGSTAPLASALDFAALLDARFAEAEAPAFLTVAPADAATAAAGLRGLARGLAQEWPMAHVRAVEAMSTLPSSRFASAVLAELTERDAGAPVVGLDGRARRALRFEPIALPGEGDLPVAPGDLVLVTGGGRGITADCAEALARDSGCRLLLLGRTALDVEEPDWARNVADADLRRRAVEALSEESRPTPRDVEKALTPIAAARAVQARLAALREAGVDVAYRALDVADAAAVRAVVAEVGPIAGLVHGAGALADRRIGDKRPDDFATVFRPKVDGLKTLLSALGGHELKLLALFSSTAAAFGNAGQSDYAMANAVVDRTAERLAESGRAKRVVAVAWGPWRAGMVTPELARRFAERGIMPIEPEQGRELFLSALRQKDAAHVVAGDDLSTAGTARGSARRRFSLAETPVLADHVIDGRPVVPAAWPLAWMLAEAEARGASIGVVEDFRVLKGLVLEENRTLPLELRLTDAGGALEAGITSAAATGPEMLHYKARLVPGDAPDCPFGIGTGSEGAGHDATAYLDGPIAYGPAFRGVTRVEQLDAEGIRLTLTLPEDSHEGPRNPLAYDLATHALLIWLEARQGAACLPSRVDRVVWTDERAGSTSLVAQATIRESDGERLVADLALFEESGRALLWMSGFEGVVVGRDHPLFARAVARRSA